MCLFAHFSLGFLSLSSIHSLLLNAINSSIEPKDLRTQKSDTFYRDLPHCALKRERECVFKEIISFFYDLILMCVHKHHFELINFSILSCLISHLRAIAEIDTKIIIQVDEDAKKGIEHSKKSNK